MGQKHSKPSRLGSAHTDVKCTTKTSPSEQRCRDLGWTNLSKPRAEPTDNGLAKHIQDLHLRDEVALKVDLKAVTYLVLWQHRYKKPQKHWTVRGLTPKEMKTIMKQLTKLLTNHQQWKGATAGRELLTAAWQHCINDCLTQSKNPFNPLSNKEIQFVIGKCIGIAKTDSHTLFNQRSTDRALTTADLEPMDVVNVAYHAILGLTGNVWKEIDHMLEASKGGDTGWSIPHNLIPNSPLPPRPQVQCPHVVPQLRNAPPTQRKTDNMELCFWAPVPPPNPDQPSHQKTGGEFGSWVAVQLFSEKSIQSIKFALLVCSRQECAKHC